jgi:hypothetical protein
MLQTYDVVRFLNTVDGKSIVEAEITSIDVPGDSVLVNVSYATQYVPAHKLQLIEGAWGRPIQHITGYDPNAGEVSALRGTVDRLQQETNVLRRDLQSLHNEGQQLINIEREKFKQVCMERDALAADLREAMA